MKEVICGSCLESQYSTFDKKFTNKYSACIDCYRADGYTEEDIERLSNKLF